MLKKWTSLMLALLLMAGIVTATAVAAHAEETEPASDIPTEEINEAPTDAPTEAQTDPSADANVLYFDADGSGWTDYDTVAFHIWAIDDDAFSGYNWGEIKQNGTQASDGRWYYDLDAAGLTIRPSKQYGIIFYAKKDGATGAQTYNLIFGTECIGHTASCEGTIYENPEDSQKTTQAAFWDSDIDATVYGPELQISSIGTVVGICCPASTSPYQLFVNFLHNTLQNARIYAGKTDQQLIDDTAAALGLTKQDVEEAINENGLFHIEWTAEDSKLPDDTGREIHTQEESGKKDDKAGDDLTVKSPKTGYDTLAALVILSMAAAVVGVAISYRKLRSLSK